MFSSDITLREQTLEENIKIQSNTEKLTNVFVCF